MGDRAMAGNCGNGNRNSELSISPDSVAILYDPNYVTYDIKYKCHARDKSYRDWMGFWKC